MFYANISSICVAFHFLAKLSRSLLIQLLTQQTLILLMVYVD